MTTATSSYNIPPRQDNTYLQDLQRDSDYVEVKVDDMERWYYRFHEAVDSGYILDVRVALLHIHFFFHGHQLLFSQFPGP